jgi:broad specificity phosphatase PhoE
MGRIVLVRHGQASLLDDDYDRLSALGLAQGAATGRWLAPRMGTPAALVSGALQRQRQTAQACAEAAGWPAALLAVDAGFDEYTHEDLFSCLGPAWADHAAVAAHLRTVQHPRREFHALFERALAAWLAGAAGSGRSWAQFRESCGAALRRVAARLGSGQAAVVVSSGGAIAAMLQPLLGVPDAQVPALHSAVFNASITQLLTRGDTVSLSSFNSVAHLELDPADLSLVTYR